MYGHDVIVVGASAGGVNALTRLVRGIPPDLPAAVFVVMHIPEHAPSALPRILARACALPVEHAVDGEAITHGRIYVAPPRAHMLLELGAVRLVAGPRENRHRPAIDPLFRSAALAYDSRVVGVVLTGALNDGTAGLLAIKRRGGLAVAQDPDEALLPSMPASALAYVDVDQCLPVASIPEYLVSMARTPAPQDELDASSAEDMQMEADIAGLHPNRRMEDDRVRNPSVFTCPECKGPLWEIHDGKLLRFRCHVGHAYTSDALLEDQIESLDDALWTALETLEQRRQLLERLAKRAHDNELPGAAKRFEMQARNTAKKVRTVERALRSDTIESPVEEQREPGEAEASAPT